MAKVFLGVGHGGKDPGAVAGLKEKDLNLSIALACRDELVRHGVDVKMSRTTDENDPLTEEIRECNAFDPDLAADIHNNAGGGDGAEVFHHYGGGTGKILAENILSEVVAIGQNSRGAKTKLNSNGKDYFGFIRETNAPAVIVECAFVDSKDIQIIDTADEQKKMGVAIAKGILKTLGIAYKAEQVKSVTDIAKEVIAGHWGNGEDRKHRLRNAGYDPAEVQKMVNELVSNTPKNPVKKTVSQIADEVIAGKWGVGAYRKKRLTLAGYDYNAVQREVNKKLR
jgi:N-acetylmuramoyl-L-alanine amidase